jgi:Putative serine esterase (DUF676)
MLLVNQTSSVKVGEIIRYVHMVRSKHKSYRLSSYTLSYEPAADRVVPSPPHLHLRIKNTSAIPLRAAYLHGPFALHVAAYPSTFNPNSKLENPRRDGMPQFEPNLKAGATFSARLNIPDDLRIKSQNEANTVAHKKEKQIVTWIIEVTSQILFSSTASVKFEIFVARDERSLNFNFNAVPSSRHAEPDSVHDYQYGHHKRRSSISNVKGVYSKAVSLVIEDTNRLWDQPPLPVWEEPPLLGRRSSETRRRKSSEPTRPRIKKKKKIHLVVLTHGLHSNLGADMLYLKESIDATARAEREEKQKRRSSVTNDASAGERETQDSEPTSIAPLSGGQKDIKSDESDSDDEEIIVRGFPGNAVRTENGIQYLGKRLARYVLDFTYPDQPVQFVKKRSLSERISRSMSSKPGKDIEDQDQGLPAHDGSKIRVSKNRNADDLAYTFSSISFVGHSLGGLVQLYAIAYIQKHAPQFFEHVEPVNFVALATPFLGLSNENPVYVKFALDFGVVGRTGQDLGLTWRPPTIARSGWSAVVGGLGGNSKSPSHEDPRAKPLLRILPTGPAHIVLRKFRNRTVYSNVVNDGIVPLRTSCLLFLDWRGLDKVEKARRENGLVGTFVGWGWAEVTGQNTIAGLDDGQRESWSDSDSSSNDRERQSQVPQPSEAATNEDDDRHSLKSLKSIEETHGKTDNNESSGPIDAILNFLRPSAKTTKNDLKMFSRSQIVSADRDDNVEYGQNDSERGNLSPSSERGRTARPLASRGDSIDGGHESPAPPKTSIFESAADVLSPPTPPTTWIIDPASRSRTIFHDRVYHPEDIPPPPGPPQRRATSLGSIRPESPAGERSTEGSSGMKVEEKIARAYHLDLSWRKVLVRLEPDAHNNIIVRRMFANAYGWPVVKHLCDTHFGDTFAARTRDEDEPATDRAHGIHSPIPSSGEKVKGQESKDSPVDVPDELLRKGTGELKPLEEGGVAAVQKRVLRDNSVEADESYLEDTSDEENKAQSSPFQRFWSPSPKSPDRSRERSTGKEKGRHKSFDLPRPPAAVVAESITAEPGSINGSGQFPTLSTSSALPSSQTGGLGLRKSVPQTVASSSGVEGDTAHKRLTELLAKSKAAGKDNKQD